MSCKAIRLALVCAGSLLVDIDAYSQFVLDTGTALPSASAGAIAWGDFDNDGRLDFFLSGGLTASIWRNTGNGFSNVTASVAPGLPGIYDSAAAWGDFDNDGRLDLLITGLTNLSTGQSISQLWHNTGDGFTNFPIPGLPGVAQSSVAWGDFDNDGHLDFLISGTSNGISDGAICQIWSNAGNGFTNVPVPGLAGMYFGALAVADFDNDGRLDFLTTGITNSSSMTGVTSQLWRNTGNGFTNVPIPGLPGAFVSSVGWADYDNDGRLDFLVEGLIGNTFFSQLWRNTGSGFTQVAVPGLPNAADGTLAWADYDNDGRPDILITGLTNGASEVSAIWRNTGNGFTNVPITGLPGSFDNALAWGDYNNDGRIDFLLSPIEGASVSQLWRNVGDVSNAPPGSPTGLSAVPGPTSVVLSWTAPADDHTPSLGLSYNLRVGTSPGGSDVVSPPALANGSLLAPQMGLVRNGSAFLDKLVPGKTYYWSVQAVDSGFLGSPFSAEQQFTIGGPKLINPFRRPDGTFEFSFAAPQGSRFVALTTTNLAAASSNWIVLGNPIESPAGQFKFIDSQAKTNSARFYRVQSL